MLRGEAETGAAERADGDRHLDAAARHEAVLGDAVDDLVEADAEEVGEHDLDDRAVAGESEAERGADEAGLGDRRVADPRRAEFLEEAETRLERPAGLADVLAHDQGFRIAPHLLLERRDDRFAVGDLLRAHATSAAGRTCGIDSSPFLVRCLPVDADRRGRNSWRDTRVACGPVASSRAELILSTALRPPFENSQLPHGEVRAARCVGRSSRPPSGEPRTTHDASANSLRPGREATPTERQRRRSTCTALCVVRGSAAACPRLISKDGARPSTSP